MLRTKLAGTPSEEAAASLLAHAVLTGRFTLKHWTSAVDQWLYRLNGLAHWCPELGLTPVGASERLFLLQQICLGSFSAKEIEDKPVWPVLKDWLAPGQEPFLRPTRRNDSICHVVAALGFGMLQTHHRCYQPASRISTTLSRPPLLPWAGSHWWWKFSPPISGQGDSRSRRVLDTHVSCSEEGTAEALSET